jgi:protein required for attachment to host cells
MKGMKIHAGDWVVVCDGRKSMILENKGDDVFPNLRKKEVSAHESIPTHAEGSDAPGRVFASAGSAHSAVEQTDWHDQEEHQFLAKLAAHLDAAVTSGQTKRVILVTPPRALGMIRKHYSPALRKAIVAEIEKDLTKTPIPEIEKRLTSAA